MILKALHRAEELEELSGFEDALLVSLQDKKNADACAEAIRKTLGKYTTAQRGILYFVLAQIGGNTNL